MRTKTLCMHVKFCTIFRMTCDAQPHSSGFEINKTFMIGGYWIEKLLYCVGKIKTNFH